ARRRDRAAAGHRFERWDAEALVEARVDQARRAPVERGELGRRDLSKDLDALGHRFETFEPAAREDEPELRPRLAQRPESLEEARVVLVRPTACGIEEDRLALLVARTEHRVVDPERGDVDPAGVEVERVPRTSPHELARDDH